jgi:SagB-type dehydrogenase family enzyme
MAHGYGKTKFLPACLQVVVFMGMTLFMEEACMAEQNLYSLPQPVADDDNPLNPILQQRRTHREFAQQPITLEQAAQLLWAAQGISSREGFRTAPSAGALYPLELHLVAGQVEGLPTGSYRYDPARHHLKSEKTGDLRQAIVSVALDQDWMAEASAIIVISAVEARTTRKYGNRGVRYVHMEVGHAGQNLLLQAVALDLVAATVGAFDDKQLQELLGLAVDERPLIILPVGHPR